MQAAIGFTVPLAMELSCGPIVLSVAVLAILITAPLGALGIDLTYKRLLQKEKPASGGEEAERGRLPLQTATAPAEGTREH